MRQFKIAITAICLMVLSYMPGHAVPAYPRLLTYTQPDGTKVSYRIKGDEKYHWIESADGFILKKSKDGYLRYVTMNDDETIVSDIVYNGDTGMAKSKAKLLSAKEFLEKEEVKRQAAQNDAIMLDGTFPLEGERKLLMILVNFADTQPTISSENFRRLMNEKDYNGTGSFRDFFLENSYNRLDIETTVTEWIQLPKPKSMYSTEDMTQLIKDALSLLDENINIADFDNDKDGELDGLSIIHQGTGQEVSGDYSDIWSHSSEVIGVEKGNVRIRQYTIQPELLLPGEMVTVGVLCHEFGHNLGAPDYYDVDYESNGLYAGTGVWDLMAEGIWNEYNKPGDSPSGINMWQKIQFGWVEPVYLTGNTKITDIPAASDEPVGYILQTSREGDYFVLENRQQQKFDRMLPGHGLIVYHVDESRISDALSMNTVNDDRYQGLYTVCASAGCDPSYSPASYGEINSGGTPFPGTHGKTELSDATLPSVHSNDGKYAYASISGITEENGKISFTYTKGDTPATVNNFKAKANRGIVSLTWEAPSEEGVKGYRIFRNSIQIAETEETGYTDEKIESRQAEYKIDVEYENGLFSPFTYATVKIPVNRIAKLSSDTEDGKVRLTWDMETELSRADTEISDVVYQYIEGNETDIAQRFNEKDFTVFDGYSISRIAFIPFSAQRLTSYKVRVWKGITASGEMQVESEDDVTEYASGQWRDVVLSSPVEIEQGYDYMIGVHGNTQESYFTIICDANEITNKLGNLVLSDGQWRSDIISYNPLIKATLTKTGSGKDFIAGESPIFNEDFDPYADADYPIGFNVYRDNEFIGFTSSRTFIDSNVSGGTHKYGVACLYEGDNEAKATERSLYVAGITGTQAAGTRITVSGHTIHVSSDTNTEVNIHTVDGIPVGRCHTEGGTASVNVHASGVYIVTTKNSTNKGTRKIIIK